MNVAKLFESDLHRSAALIISVAVIVLSIVVFPSSSMAAKPSLAQLPGADGCFIGVNSRAPLNGCSAGRSMQSSQTVVLSPDGKNLYAPSNSSWSLAAFKRDPHSGKLRQMPGKQGCFVSMSSGEGCTKVRGLVWTFWAVVSHDGKNVYVGGGLGHTIVVFKRNTNTGALSQLQGQRGCLIDVSGGSPAYGPTVKKSGCLPVSNLVYVRGIDITKDDRFLIASGFSGRTVISLRRDPADGALTPVEGGCVSEKKKAGCSRVPTLAGVTDVKVSSDGKFVYSANYLSSSVTAISMNPVTGALSAVAQGGCFSAQTIAGCQPARGLSGAYNLALSPDGRFLYSTARNSGGVAIFSRDASTGGLSQAGGAGGCVNNLAASGCGRSHAMRGARGIGISPDGKRAYVGSFSSSSVSTLLRNPLTGTLSQPKGKAGCISNVRRPHGKITTPGCTPGRGLANAWGIAISRDGRFVYTGVGTDGNSGIGVFRRTG